MASRFVAAVLAIIAVLIVAGCQASSMPTSTPAPELLMPNEPVHLFHSQD